MDDEEEVEVKKPLWHIKKFECPNCLCAAQMMELAFNSMGGVFVGGICIRCSQSVTWESNIFNVTSCCLTADGVIVVEGNETVQ